MKHIKSITVNDEVWDLIPARKKSGFIESSMVWLLINMDKNPEIYKEIRHLQRLRKKDMYKPEEKLENNTSFIIP